MVFKSVTRNNDSQAEVSKNGAHITDTNMKSVATPSQMTASGMWDNVHIYVQVDEKINLFLG